MCNIPLPMQADEYFMKSRDSVYCGSILINDADPESFVSVEAGYGKDNNHVYIGSNLIEGADPTSFVVIAGDYAYSKDNYNVYWVEDY